MTVRPNSGARPGDPGTLPCRFGDYVLLARLALGGMAEVFLAKHLGLEGFEKLVVVKRILPELGELPDFVQMFRDEARIAARLNHPNIVQIFNLGKVGASYFIAMEHVDGEDLRHTIKAALAAGETGVPLPLLCRIFADVCGGLHYAHTFVDDSGRPLQLVHRDVTPHNVIVSYSGFTKILDFGVAKASIMTGHTRAGTVKGKFGYVSPEQGKGKEIDHRSDLFSVGVCMWELAAGQRLFRRDGELAMLSAILEATPDPPSAHNPTIPPGLDKIILRALEKDAKNRYQTAHEMQVDIEQFARASGLQAGGVEVGQYMRRLFAEKLANRERLVREQRVESFEQLLLDERTKTIDQSLLGIHELEPDLFAEVVEEPAEPGDEAGGDSGSAPAGGRAPTAANAAPRRSRRLSPVIAVGIGLGLALAAGLVLFVSPHLFPDETGDLVVSSDPPGAEVLVDGEDTGKRTPVTLRLPAARAAAIGLALDGYLPWSGSVEITSGEESMIDADLVRAGSELGTIVVEIGGTTEATVSLDGRRVARGTDRVSIPAVDPSVPHVLLLEAPGFRPITREVAVDARATTTLEITMIPEAPVTTSPATAISGDPTAARTGSSASAGAPATSTKGKTGGGPAAPAYFTIDVDPYAVVYLDGKKLGPTPIADVAVRPGKHTLVLVGDGGKKKKVVLHLKPGQRFIKRYVLD